MTTWPDVPTDHLFGRDALPYGVMVTPAGSRVVVRYGDHALDLRAVADLEPDSAWVQAWREPTLDAFLALGRQDWDAARVWLRDALADPLRQEEWAAYLTPVEQVSLALPFTVGDYVDCYASEHHATNVGRIFRPDGEALTPNWRHLPIGYHGRSQTVVVTGTEVVRPAQRLERSRHPGVGVRAARPLPRQVLRDVDLRLGPAHGGAVCGPGAAAHPGAAAAALPVWSRRHRV